MSKLQVADRVESLFETILLQPELDRIELNVALLVLYRYSVVVVASKAGGMLTRAQPAFQLLSRW